ncbi:hypothetical protein [Nocardia sp. NBC_01388]|uniref:hypothetical protein n=1 Tax=Nocardia sp. NBC_01388 TaxID=2903596 RepID=UPI003250D302
MRDSTEAPDRWGWFVILWVVLGFFGFIGSTLLFFFYAISMDSHPPECGYRVSCPLRISLGLGAIPLYVWALAGAVALLAGLVVGRRGVRVVSVMAAGTAAGTIVFLACGFAGLQFLAAYMHPGP